MILRQDHHDFGKYHDDTATISWRCCDNITAILRQHHDDATASARLADRGGPRRDGFRALNESLPGRRLYKFVNNYIYTIFTIILKYRQDGFRALNESLQGRRLLTDDQLDVIVSFLDK